MESVKEWFFVYCLSFVGKGESCFDVKSGVLSDEIVGIVQRFGTAGSSEDQMLLREEIWLGWRKGDLETESPF